MPYRRPVGTCQCCRQTRALHGRGWCSACYSRWHYHGRPAAGPPVAGALPRRAQPQPVPDLCYRGHPFGANLAYDSRGVRFCRLCRTDVERAYRARKFLERHQGHETITAVSGRRWCLSCSRGSHDMDEMAVERAASGDPPDRLTAAEREAAVLLLQGKGLTQVMIAQRVGCHLRTVYAIKSRAASAA